MGFVGKSACLVLLLAVLLGARLHQVGITRDYPLSAGEGYDCHRVEMTASEDFIYDVERNRALISVANFGHAMENGMLFTSPENGIYSWVLGEDKAVRLKIIGYPGAMLAPHGMSFVDNVLYVVDHGYHADKECVVTFDVDQTHLTFRKAVCSPLMAAPNAVVGIPGSPDSFYVVNVHYFKMGSVLPVLIEDLLGFRTASVLRCHSGSDCEVVAYVEPESPGIELANGQLFVSQILSSRIVVLNATTGAFLHDIPLSMGGPDNLHFDNKGQLWTATNPSLLQSVNHLISGAKPAPAVAVVVNVDTRSAKVEFATKTGHPVSMASVAFPLGEGENQILALGTVRDGFAWCKRK